MFKELFTEAPSYDKKIVELISTAHLPITPKITEYLGFGDKKVVFHATNLEHLKNLKKTGKSKKAISTFTRGLHGLVFLAGMAVNPDVVAKLEGNAIMEFESDAYSHPDKQGRRWVDVGSNKEGDFLRDALLDKTIKMIYDFLGLYRDYEEFYKHMKNDVKFFQDTFNNLTNKQKQKVIAFYIANAENLMNNTMHSKIINKLIMSDVEPYNEILMNKFKVLGVYSIEYGKFKFNHENAQSIIEDMGYKYLGHIPKSEFKNVTPETY